jgi:hypothetical protein
MCGSALIELELELIQTQMAQKPMLRAKVYARALCASQKRERERMYLTPNGPNKKKRYPVLSENPLCRYHEI